MIKLKVYSVPICDVDTTKDGHLVISKNRTRRLLGVTEGTAMETFIAKIKEEYRTTVSPEEIIFVEDVELIDVFDEDPYVAGYDKLGRFWIAYDYDRTDIDWECKDCIWARSSKNDLTK